MTQRKKKRAVEMSRRRKVTYTVDGKPSFFEKKKSREAMKKPKTIAERLEDLSQAELSNELIQMYKTKHGTWWKKRLTKRINEIEMERKKLIVGILSILIGIAVGSTILAKICPLQKKKKKRRNKR